MKGFRAAISLSGKTPPKRIQRHGLDRGQQHLLAEAPVRVELVIRKRAAESTAGKIYDRVTNS